MHDGMESQGGCGGHGHDCTNCGSEGTGSCGAPKTIEDYLNLIYKQNQVANAKLSQVAGDLKLSGREEAAEHLKKSISEFEKGNMWLGLALSSLK